MSEKFKAFDDGGLTALTNHMKTTRTKANSNEAAIESLGEDLVELSSEVVAALAGKAPIGHTHNEYLTSYTETDPTVPAWAKAASKPTYTASEVGAAPSSHDHDEYQPKLTFDTAPKYNSTNPVTSGGVYTALLDKQNKITGTSGQFVGFNAAGFPIAKDLTLPTGFARCAGTYDSANNRYTVTLPDAMDSIPTGYAFILIPDADNTAASVDIYANYKTAGGQSKSSIVELRYRNTPANTMTSSEIPANAIKTNMPLIVVKGVAYWFVDSMVQYDATALIGAVPIANGGTGATDAASARSNLGITLANLGAAASSHNQAASTITAGTFAGQVVANSSGETYSTFCLRNTRLASSDTNPTVNGEICWTYG